MLDLEAIELIKQLKARYFRFLDTRNMEGLATVFTEDAKAHFLGGSYEFSLNSWAELEVFYTENFSEQKFGLHTGHHPEISVSGDTAIGLWYLHDVFINLEQGITTQGSALYEDSYVKINSEWKIKSTRYKRLLESVEKNSTDMVITSKPIGK